VNIRPPRSQPRLSTARALLYGTLAVGTLDILFALVYYGFRGVKPLTIFQSIASGLLGRPSYQGGLATAALGAVLQYVISFGIVATYLVASRKWGLLRRHPYVCGELFGVVAWLVMTRVVVPLSAAAVGPRPTGTALIGPVLAHIFLIGIPAALAARAASPELPGHTV
jgi:hypothetical protein